MPYVEVEVTQILRDIQSVLRYYDPWEVAWMRRQDAEWEEWLFFSWENNCSWQRHALQEKSKSSTDANWPGSKKTKWDALKTACVILACWVRGKLKNEGEKRQPRKNKIKLHNQKIPQSSTSLQFGSRYKAAFVICKHHMPKSSNKSSTLPKYSFFLANGVKTSS